MLSEDFDKKIREAANHHHPPYDEQAWGGMKKLLDKHLPEEKDDRRRFIFFLLLFLLLGGGAALLVTGNLSGKKNDKTIAVNTAGNDKQKPVAATEGPAAENSSDPVSDKEKKTPEGATAAGNENPSADPQPGLQYSGSDLKLNTVVKNEKQPTDTDKRDAGKKSWKPQKINKDLPAKTESSDKEQAPVALQPVSSAGKPSDNQKAETAATMPSVPQKDDGRKGETKVAQEKPPLPAKTENNISEVRSPEKKTKPAAKKRSSFFLSASAGPDVSFTGNDKLGRMKLLGGAGIGYTFREKFTLRTGFYSARKVYTSSPEEYHGSPWFYQYYPNLQKIEADCKVYEIPVLLSYNFGGGNKSNWFASTGISSLIMKEETYNYYYKYTPGGPTVNRSNSTYNQNKHFFSVLTVSAGYQRSIGNKFSVIAEPYFKAPLNGVGNGKVKLNSTGVLFSVTYNPFQSINKK